MRTDQSGQSEGRRRGTLIRVSRPAGSADAEDEACRPKEPVHRGRSGLSGPGARPARPVSQASCFLPSRHPAAHPPEAPDTSTYTLSLPPGAELKQAGSGGAEVLSGEEQLLLVPDPTAIDADGNPVPVALRIEGDSITIAAHPDATTIYPVLVDPLWGEWQWSETEARSGSVLIRSLKDNGGTKTSTLPRRAKIGVPTS